MLHRFRKGILRAASVAAFGAGVWLQAGEKVEMKGSTAVELPKPTRRSFEEGRRFKFNSEASELEGGFAPTPSANNAAPIDRKLREALDRKKNWIFVNPYEKQTDSRTSEILEKDEGPNLLDHRLLKEDDKGAMQKFMEEKANRGSENKNAPSAGASPTSSSETRDRETSEKVRASFKEPEDEATKDEKTTAMFLDPGSSKGLMFKPMESGLEMSDFQKRMERSPLEGSVFTANRPADTTRFDKDELKRQQDTREAEFNKLLQPRGLAGGSGRMDPLNTAADGTRQEMNPAGPRRTDTFLSGGRTDFGGANRANGVAASVPGANSLDFGSVNARAAKESSFLPPPPSGTAASGSGFGKNPFSREIPRRKF